METSVPTKEGFVSFRGYDVWYRIVGDTEEPGRYPLLCLHGGPGAPHDYLEPLEVMAATGRRVIFYDQLGCGYSDQPHDPSLWTVDLFVDELGIVRDMLELGQCHILGHSWGGMLAMEYAFTKPSGIVSLILASSLASLPQWMSEAQRLRAELSPEVQETLTVHEQAGTTNDPAYEEAMMVFYGKHLCRLDPFPEYVMRSFTKLMQNPEVYNTMWGPSEFFATGTLKEWDITDRLGEIRVPTLITSGRYDEATPVIAGTLHSGIPGSEWVLFEHSSHISHAEEPAKYAEVLGKFLNRIESQP